MLTANDAAEWDSFGRPVLLSCERVLIGAASPFHDDIPESGSGSDYVYQ